MTSPTFPKDFKWGTATASYQIEGAVTEDGRGPSIWDTFSHTPGKTLNGDTGDVGPDHYHRWQDDIRLMKQLGLNSYRYSISWPRVLPQGTGAVNAAGLDFYDRLTDDLLAAGISPAVTLYHWDLPQALEDQGGWANRDIVDAFVRYTDVVVRKLGDRVKLWITLNEPQVYTFAGYGSPRHAPGKNDLRLALRAAHNTLLAHGRAVPTIREVCPGAEVGITLNLYPFYPASDTQADKLAAHMHEGQVNRMFLDPVFGHGYPASMRVYYNDMMPETSQDDMKQIAAPLDFLGINYYFPMHSMLTNAQQNRDGFMRIQSEELIARGYKLTEMGWPVDANGLIDLLNSLQKEYGPKAFYITENGASFVDQVVNGQVNDTDRVAYLAEHIAACKRAIDNGIPLKGYYLWSFMDNFEWGWGFSKRFGIVYVDYQTLQRVPKQSYYYYQKVIAANAPVAVGE